MRTIARSPSFPHRSTALTHTAIAPDRSTPRASDGYTWNFQPSARFSHSAHTNALPPHPGVHVTCNPSPLAWAFTFGFGGASLSSHGDAGTSAGSLYRFFFSASATPLSAFISDFMLKCTAPLEPSVVRASFT